ncbi:MAG: hypothetical protein ACF8K1_04555 [Phycisphaerales bacterium JB047]
MPHPLAFTIALAAVPALTLAQPGSRPPPPTNCTQTFSHNDSIEVLLDQLRDDDIRHNLRRALPVLRTHPDLTPEFLYAQLNHEDWQVRQVICREIWSHAAPRPRFVENPAREDGKWPGGTLVPVDPDPDYPITETLVRVTIEGLRHDTTPYDHPRRRGLIYPNANFGTSVLTPIADQWADLLINAMESDDQQQRLIAAAILSKAGITQAAPRAAQILLPHLRHNDIGEDAKFATHALFGYGQAILPHLTDALPAADTQQRNLILLIIRDIQHPPLTEKERLNNRQYNTITQTVHDPAYQQAPTPGYWFNQLY